MTWDYFFALAVLLGTAAYDAYFTSFRISIHGKEIELNSLIRGLVRRFGPKTGTWIGVAIPTIVTAIAGAYFHDLIMFMAGARTTLFGFQLYQTLHSS